MLLRPKTPADAEAAVALMRSTHEVDGYPRYWPGRPERFLTPAPETDGWVVEDASTGGGLLGHVALHDAAGDPTLPAAQRATGLPPERLAVVARLMVHPRARRSGVGAALLQAAVTRAAAQDRRPVLDVLQESAGAIAFYERAGWTRLEPLTLELGDVSGVGAPDVPPLQLWVYLAPWPAGTTSAG